MIECDVAVIGSGPGGYVAAIRAAQLGSKVAIIEREELGGVCLNWGCIPTKTLIYTAGLYRKMKDANSYGLHVDGLKVDFSSLLKRKNDVVRKNKAGVQNLLKTNGVQVVKGDASVVAPGKIQVGNEEVRAKSIIAATGSSPAQIPGLEIDGKQVISSTEALDLPSMPKRIAVVGAGALGAEFACIWNAFGVEVTLIELLPNVLPREDDELTAKLATIFKKQGIDVRTGTKIARMQKSAKSIALNLEGKHPGDLEVDLVLIGIGRRYHSDVFAPSAGVTLGPRGEVLVNERMETNVAGIFAIGDVTGKTLLAHGASAEGLVAAANAAGGNKRMDYRVLPACTFTSPEIASVGLTEKAAKEQGKAVKIGRFPFAASGRAHAMGETEGLVKIVGDANTDEVIGVHIMGAEAGELIASAALAMSMEATVEEIAHTIHTHPTLSEAIMEAAEDYLGAGIHTPAKRAR
jgi:dihydrolipoamide dehydrogenase